MTTSVPIVGADGNLGDELHLLHRRLWNGLSLLSLLVTTSVATNVTTCHYSRFCPASALLAAEEAQYFSERPRLFCLEVKFWCMGRFATSFEF